MSWLSKSLLLALIFFIFHSHFISSSSSFVKCRPEMRTALLNLTILELYCDSETGHVTALRLYFPNRTIITPESSLFSLHHLLQLQIYGSDHVELGSDAFHALTRNLTKIQALVLSEINMSSLPPASLMNLSSSLTYLSIQSCRLTGEFPHNSFHFPNLQQLSLFNNNLQGPIPPWIYALPNLTALVLDSNLFSGEIGEFQTSSLFALSVSNNKLQGAFPRSLFHQMKLENLVLSLNNFTGTVELQELSKLINLTYLNLFRTNLSLTNNCENCILEKLKYLSLGSCNLTEFPNFLRATKILDTLDLSNNQIKGTVPKWFNELESLRMLDLHSNLFFGPLPIFSPQLSFFSATKNQFSGEIPFSICNTTSLRILDLSYNNLTGRIPPCVGNVESLSFLDVRSNNLHGEIPESLFVNAIRLRSLSLNGNQLEGKLPRSLVNCAELEVLDLGNNELNDTFPAWLQSLPNLQVLVLRGNKLHGSIGNPNPGSLPFQNLTIMDLSHNDFTGALPTTYVDNFKAMQMETRDPELSYVGEKKGYFSYYRNSVTVTMKGFEFVLDRILTIFTTMDFSSNNFTGEIPELLGKLKSLKGLNLSHNALTGILPPSLGNLSNMEWLDLSCNELVGKIPVELADIHWLSSFNVSHNHLEGPIPQGKQFNTFSIESFVGNSDLCGFPLPKSCGGGATEPSEPSLEQDNNDDDSSNVTNGFNWRIVMMGYASGLVIGISIGYMLLYSNGKLRWISERIVEEIEYRRAIRPKRRNARRPLRR